MMTSEGVHEIRPGIWRIELELPGHSIGHVNVYVLSSTEGTVLVDSGWGTEWSLSQLDHKLASIGVSPSSLAAIVLTHGHADHAGAAGRLAQRSGAWVGLHEEDVALVQAHSRGRPGQLESRDWTTRAGVPLSYRRVEQRRVSRGKERFTGLPDVRRLVRDQLVEVGPWQLRAIHTPGHTPGHLCYELVDQSVMFTGDHVMARINSGPTGRLASHQDPIGTYLASLLRLRDSQVALALPGHQEPIVDLQARLELLLGYHRDRLAEILERLEETPGATAWELASVLPRRRAWASLSELSKLAACSQALAHLRHLERRGLAAPTGATPERWQRATRV